METKKSFAPYYTFFVEYYIRSVLQDRYTPRGVMVRDKVREWLKQITSSDFIFLTKIFNEHYQTVKEAIIANGNHDTDWNKLHSLEKDCIIYLDL